MHPASTGFKAELEAVRNAVEALDQLAALGEQQLLVLEEIDDLPDERLYVLAGEHQSMRVIAVMDRACLDRPR